MSASRVPFIQVIPDEIEQYGAAAAVVLAHIRYRCQSGGPGRTQAGGVRWWRVSYAELGREVGLDRESVRRALKPLANALESEHHEPLDDQRRSYRVASDLPYVEYDTTMNSHMSNTTPPVVNTTPPVVNTTPPHVAGDICTTTGELGEVREEEGELAFVDAEVVDAHSSQIGQISEHHESIRGRAKAAPDTRGTRLPERWMPADDTIRQMHQRFPGVDLRGEHEKFTNYWIAQPGAKGRKVDWEATWRNWIIRAAEQANHSPSAQNGIGKPSRKAQGWHDAGEELIAEMNEAGALLPEVPTSRALSSQVMNSESRQ